MGFEVANISFKASQGQQSHFNFSTPLNAIMFSLMAIAASLATILTAYIGILFFTNTFSDLPNYYVWSIRFGIILFVIFAFEGFLMGLRSSHSVGAVNDNSKVFILGWSTKYGDLRIAHFIGMHALQVLPIISFYILKNTKVTFLVSLLYFCLAIFTLVQAINGKPLLKRDINLAQNKKK